MKRLCLSVVLFVLVFAPAARADDLYNNLSATSTGTVGASTGDSGPLADSFSTGANPFDFNSLTVALSGLNTGDIVTVSLLSDASNSPGPVLEAFDSDLFLSSTVTDLTFGSGAAPAPSYSYMLAPNTRYWIELSLNALGAELGNWSYSIDTSGTGVAGEYSASQPNFSVGDHTWFVVPNSVGPFQMEVAGTTVPEPPSVILLATGLAAPSLSCVRETPSQHP